MRIAEVVRETPKIRHQPTPHSASAIELENVRQAAKTLVDWLRSLGSARFTLYGADFQPALIGEVVGGNVFPADLEQRLIEPTRQGFTMDLEILGSPRRWLSIVFPAGGGPAKRVVRFRTAPKGQVGRPWAYGLQPDRVRRITTTIGDLVAAASQDL